MRAEFVWRRYSAKIGKQVIFFGWRKVFVTGKDLWMRIDYGRIL